MKIATVVLPALLLGASLSAGMFAQETAAAPPMRTGATAGLGNDSLLMMSQQAGEVQTLHINVGRAMVLTTKAPLKRVYIGDPSVLESFTASSQEIVLTAKACGRSSLVLWDKANHSYVYSVSADVDAAASREAFRASFPHAAISVDGRESKLFLSGTVQTEAASEAAFKLASSYTKDVVNTLQVVPVHGKQVQLQLRIIEVDRAKAEQFGVNFLTGGGRTLSALGTQQFNSAVTQDPSTGKVTVSDPLNLFLYNYKLNFGLTLKDLESKQILQVLAEPTLTTISGLPARFLSGGEFPVPVAQGGTGNSTAITIMFRPYGIKVDFTPTVNADGTIRLKVSPEVSALDYTNAVTLSGTTVPALSTRKAETEVEIRDGESFIVSGLLDHRTTDSLASVPGIANLPVLGHLFRSKNLNHSVVELVVLVTATVVDPLAKPVAPAVLGMVVPNLDSDGFDIDVRKLLKTAKPAADGTPDPGTAITPGQPVASVGKSLYVEVCAMSHREDAEIVITSLRRKGYPAYMEAAANGRQTHVRVGPFVAPQDVTAAQQRLLGDGFNAMVPENTMTSGPMNPRGNATGLEQAATLNVKRKDL